MGKELIPNSELPAPAGDLDEPGGRLSVGPAVNLQAAKRHCPLTRIKLYCLVDRGITLHYIKKLFRVAYSLKTSKPLNGAQMNQN